MILTHHGINSLSKNSIPTELVIGDKTYPVVVIGNRAWLQYNLDYSWNGLDLGGYTSSNSIPVAAYPDNSNRTFGWSGYRAGLLYNRPAIKYIQDNVLPLYPGWRIPTRNDFGSLFSKDYKDLLSTAFPWNGTPERTNATGFTAVGGGRRTGDYAPDNSYRCSYMAVEQSNSNAFAYIETSASRINVTNHEYFYSGDVELSLRLVRDAV